MVKIPELQQQHAALVEDMRKIHETAKEEKRDLTPEESKTWEAKKAEALILKGIIDRETEIQGYVPEAITKRIQDLLPGPSDRKSGFRSFGEFLCAIKFNPADNRLVSLRTGSNEGVDTAGGFLVPTEFKPAILAVALESSIIRASGATVIPMGSDSIAIPKIVDSTHASTVFGGIVASWTEEAGTLSGVDPTFGQVKLIAHKLAGYTYASNELLADSAIALEALLIRMFGEALAYYEDTAFFSGDGVGKPLGIMNSGALLAINRSAATTVAAADIANMWARFMPGSHGRAVWFANPTVLAQLIKLSTTPITWLNTPGSTPNVASAPPSQLMGKPIYFTEKCKALGTAGDIILADPSYYLIGDRQPITIASSEHVRFTTDQTAWRFVERVDGQPWVDAAFTPANGSTLSPFVTLYTATTGGS